MIFSPGKTHCSCIGNPAYKQPTKNGDNATENNEALLRCIYELSLCSKIIMLFANSTMTKLSTCIGVQEWHRPNGRSYKASSLWQYTAVRNYLL